MTKPQNKLKLTSNVNSRENVPAFQTRVTARKLMSKATAYLFKKQSGLRKASNLGTIIVAGFFVCFSLYHLVLAKRIIPGVYVGTVKLSGLTYEQATEKLTTTIQNSTQTLQISAGTKSYQVTPRDLKLNYDITSTIENAMAVGRKDTLYINTKRKLAGLLKHIQLVPTYSYDKTFLASVVSQIKTDSDFPAKNAEFMLAEDTKSLGIVPEAEGKSVKDQAIYEALKYSLDNIEFSEKKLEVKKETPTITQIDLQRIKPKLEKIVLKDFTLKANNQTYVLHPQDLIELINIRKEDGNVVILVDRNNFNSYQETLAKQINQLPIGEVTETNNGRVTNFRILKNGLQIDDKNFSGEFKQALFGGKEELEVPMTKVESSSNGEEYGILTLLGTGVSKFVGSAQPRVQNLTLAAQRTSGILVPPGETYSFNNAIGQISAATGYATAYIISQGRTVLGEGGGVCQTSTTLFRAVLNAGLPIISRYPHAYRVSYYEQDSPVGLDASVYQPSLDFKFKNDTPSYVLVQASWNLETSTLQFDLYGTPDGRKVELSKPSVTNVIAPPTASYQDDPTLPKGSTKQVDFAAWGSTVEFQRKVTRGDETLSEDTFRSVYQPWRAVYLVGTK